VGQLHLYGLLFYPSVDRAEISPIIILAFLFTILFYRKSKRNEEKFLVKISKQEKEKLLEMGCRWHKDLHKTYSHHPSYFLTESPKNMAKLNKIRDYSN